MTNAEAIEILKGYHESQTCFNEIIGELDDEFCDALGLAISALEKQEAKKPIAVETNIYDTEEIHHGCTVQVLRNSVTGNVSVGWWKEKEEEE